MSESGKISSRSKSTPYENVEGASSNRSKVDDLLPNLSSKESLEEIQRLSS